MEKFSLLLLTLGICGVYNSPPVTAQAESHTTAVYPYLIPEPVIESIDNLYRALVSLYRSCIISIRKYFLEELEIGRKTGSYINKNVSVKGSGSTSPPQNQKVSHYKGTLHEMIMYMQEAVCEIDANLKPIIEFFNGLVDGSVLPPEELCADTVQIITDTWVDLQNSLNRLNYDIDSFRADVAQRIESVMSRYEEETAELHAQMKFIYHEVEIQSMDWIRIVGQVSRKTLVLPRAFYYVIDLEEFYSEWQKIFISTHEVNVAEILNQSWSLAHTVHNAVGVHFFLPVSMRLKATTWPYFNLIFRDSANLKRLVDRGFIRLESYLSSWLNFIEEEKQAENYDQSYWKYDDVKKQIESDCKMLVDLTEISYRRIYDAMTTSYFEIYATDLCYTNAFYELLSHLVELGFVIDWDENEFAPIDERVEFIANSESSLHAVSENDLTILGNYEKYLQPSPNAYQLILHENILHEILDIYKILIDDLRNLPQNNLTNVILLNLREDGIFFAQTFQYLRMYVSQSGLFIDGIYVDTVEEYMHLLISLDLDVRRRLDILSYRVWSTFQHAVEYLEFANSWPQLPFEEEVVVKDTRFSTDIPILSEFKNNLPPFIFESQVDENQDIILNINTDIHLPIMNEFRSNLPPFLDIPQFADYQNPIVTSDIPYNTGNDVPVLNEIKNNPDFEGDILQNENVTLRDTEVHLDVSDTQYVGNQNVVVTSDVPYNTGNDVPVLNEIKNNPDFEGDILQNENVTLRDTEVHLDVSDTQYVENQNVIKTNDVPISNEIKNIPCSEGGVVENENVTFRDTEILLNVSDTRLVENQESAATEDMSTDIPNSKDSRVSNVPLGGGNDMPSSEEIEAALNLLSRVYQTVDLDGDGEMDLMLSSAFNTNSLQNGDTIIANENMEKLEMREVTVQDSNFVGKPNNFQNEIISGSQHEEAIVNSDSSNIIDFDSDGKADAILEKSTDQVITEDRSYKVLGDLNPYDGVTTNTVIETIEKTESVTNEINYIVDENKQ